MHNPNRNPGIRGNVKPEALEIFSFRFDGDNLRRSSGLRCNQEREQSNIGADINEYERPGHRLGLVDVGEKFFPLADFIHLRREERSFFASIAARVQAHSQAPPHDVQAVIIWNAHGDETAQTDCDAESQPVVRQTAGCRDDGAIEPSRRSRPIRFCHLQICSETLNQGYSTVSRPANDRARCNGWACGRYMRGNFFACHRIAMSGGLDANLHLVFPSQRSPSCQKPRPDKNR